LAKRIRVKDEEEDELNWVFFYEEFFFFGLNIDIKMMIFNFFGDVHGGVKEKTSENGRLKMVLKKYDVERLL